ncbi:MAG: response regulator, partial [Candidatus Cloacimonadota bacterium]|nr:response regulator [Candidatus Cloacimonadota bacterium]
MKKRINILIVEDELIIANGVKVTLEKFGYNIVDIAKTGEAAMQKIEITKPDLVLVDIMLEGKLDGIDITDTIQQVYNIPVIYVTAYSNPRRINKAKLTAPYGYITKPFEDKELYYTIEMALHKSQLDRVLKEAKCKIEKLHSVAINLATCESRKSIFKETGNALENLFSISDFVFYRKQKNQLVLQTEEPLTIFKAKYNITEGIAGEVFSSNGMLIYSKQLELAAIEPNWKDVGSVIGCRI